MELTSVLKSCEARLGPRHVAKARARFPAHNSLSPSCGSRKLKVNPSRYEAHDDGPVDYKPNERTRLSTCLRSTHEPLDATVSSPNSPKEVNNELEYILRKTGYETITAVKRLTLRCTKKFNACFCGGLLEGLHHHHSPSLVRSIA